jgi:hypothetical protein
MRVLSVFKPGQGGGGVSQTARYIATRDRDEAREGAAPRPLFSAHAEHLTYPQANRWLGGAHAPRTTDLLHVVISLAEEQDFNRLGANEAARQQGLRETTRRTLQDLAAHWQAGELRWAAGIHRNTDNPHVHLLLQREYTERETGRVRRLPARPTELCLRWVSTPTGERVAQPGRLSEFFVAQLNRQHERAVPDRPAPPPPDRTTRELWGKALLATIELEQRQAWCEQLRTAGAQQRYWVTGAHGQRRRMSEGEVQRRLNTTVARETARIAATWHPAARQQWQAQLHTAEQARYAPVLAQLRAQHAAALQQAETQWQRAAATHAPLLAQAEPWLQTALAADRAVPVPWLARDELDRLQAHAQRHGHAARYQQLEAWRTQLAAEQGWPPRSEKEPGRLHAQRLLAESALALAEHEAAHFETIQHVRRWPQQAAPPGGATPHVAPPRSLVEVERELRLAQDQMQFAGQRQLHWDDAARAAARQRVAELQAERTQVLAQIAAERTRLQAQVAQRAEFVAAWHVAHPAAPPGGTEAVPPRLTPAELHELARQAERRRAPALMAVVLKLERAADAHALGGLTGPLLERLSRAQARELMAEIAVREQQARLEQFAAQRQHLFTVVGVNGHATPSLTRLAEVTPRSPLERWLRPGWQQQPIYQTVTAALTQQAAHLQQAHADAHACHQLLQADRQAYETEFRAQQPGLPLPPPRFTDRELNQLELHAAHIHDPAERARYLQLVRAATQPATPATRPADPRAPSVTANRPADDLPALAATLPPLWEPDKLAAPGWHEREPSPPFSR